MPANAPEAGRPRWLLHLQALMWRFLMQIGMTLHKLAPPRPPSPAFSRIIPTAVSPHAGTVSILFYTPPDYKYQKRITNGSKKWPIVVNFHGGGFTLGAASDDARWAAALTKQANAIVASVEYRRAPEYSFPTAVEDGVDAVLYVAKHAEELCIDKHKIAVSGFSSGGNMAFTVPLRLQEELDPSLEGSFAGGSDDTFADVMQQDIGKGTTKRQSIAQEPQANYARARQSLSQTTSPETQRTRESIKGSSTIHGVDAQGRSSVAVTQLLQPLNIVAIISWYPGLDWTLTREQRKATCKRPDQLISATFTSLFDESYLQPPTLAKENPYLSPGVAKDDLLAALPENILLYTCEWDMLLKEAEVMKERLDKLGKKVTYKMVPEVPHGWDKAPNPLKEPKEMKEVYADACKRLKNIFSQQ